MLPTRQFKAMISFLEHTMNALHDTITISQLSLAVRVSLVSEASLPKRKAVRAAEFSSAYGPPLPQPLVKNMPIKSIFMLHLFHLSLRSLCLFFSLISDSFVSAMCDGTAWQRPERPLLRFFIYCFYCLLSLVLFKAFQTICSLNKSRAVAMSSWVVVAASSSTRPRHTTTGCSAVA
jgi:hypothetical protein